MTTSRTRISLLGRIAIERGDEPDGGASLAGRRAEIVFALLAVEHRRSVSRDELADALWPRMLPDTWNAALRGVISDVRRFLERAGLDPAQTLLTEQGRLRLQLPEDATVDVDEAHAALAHARERAAEGAFPEAALAATAAADLAALPFLPSHDEGWVAGVRSDLDRLHVDALHVAGEAFSRAGEPREALGAADRLVRADPFLESAHRLRIAMLGALGDRAGAVKAYERCEAMLSAELGIAPSTETEQVLRVALGGGRSPEEATGAGASPLPRFSAYSVLVVEDHDFQRRTTLTLLRGLGVRRLQDAADGVAALALLDATAAPDVIVCDIDMPGMDGVEFIRNVAERRLASAVIIASGLDGRVLETVRAASEGYGLQVLGAVGKPLTAASLESLLARYRPQGLPPAGGVDATASIAALGAALDDRSLAVTFAPVVDLGVGRVTGYRATVPACEEPSLARAVDDAGLGRRLVEHALREARNAGRDLHLDAFVDLSPSLLHDVSLADALAAITRDRVVLAAEARALAADHGPAMLDVLARLRVKGFGLCVDGFEPGPLERLPITHVQLPSELVATASQGGDATPLQGAVGAARRLGVPMMGRCATAAEFDLLLQIGCSLAHGPYLAPAVPASQLAAVVLGWTAPPVAIDGPR